MDINTIEKSLKSKRDELLAKAEKLHGDVHNRKEPYDKDLSEQAIELENLDVLLELDRETRQELKLVIEAISRIESGDYGQCQACGAAINPDRLAALPYTDRCISCADRAAS